jgi:two-component system chemotaxis response regulator CheY
MIYEIKKILVVEDLSIMRRVLINSLKTLGYNDILEAEDGNEALELMGKHHFDLVITDWIMPKFSGLDLARAMRSNKKLENVPILMVTSKDNKTDVMEAMRARVNDYIVKPFTAQTLEKKIKKIELQNSNLKV